MVFKILNHWVSFNWLNGIVKTIILLLALGNLHWFLNQCIDGKCMHHIFFGITFSNPAFLIGILMIFLLFSIQIDKIEK